jgi:acetyl-CoA carboxylase carboxyl transferase subunit alpha
MQAYLDFEKPIADLESKIEELRHLSSEGEVNIADEVQRLQEKVQRLLTQTYDKLTPWQKAQVARHQKRPHALAYINAMIDDFTPLAGDRAFADDKAIVGGLGRFRGHSVVVIGNEKGNSTESRIHHNFGMAKPEGYRKAQRLMDLADRFQIPLITLVDTPGAYPGIDAEARGQAEAIARSIEKCISIRAPFVSVIIGGSGGAIALAVADRVLMLEHAIYSVISPEGCASILWRAPDKAPDAAEALRVTSRDLLKLGVIDHIISEPLGGAHRQPDAIIARTGDEIEKCLEELIPMSGSELRSSRREKFLSMGTKGLN